MKIQKSFIELAPYAMQIGETTVVPMEIEANDTTCTFRFQAVMENGKKDIII